MISLIKKFICVVSCLPDWIYTTIARFAVGFIFLVSGLLKVDDNYAIKDITYDLFRDVHFARVSLPEGVMNILTIMGTYAELILPLLLIIGLGSRFAALGLLIMTIVIQFVVFPDQLLTYREHGLWAVALLAVLIKGPGPFSLDYFIKKGCSK